MSTRIECDGCDATVKVERHGTNIELMGLNGWRLNSFNDSKDYCPNCWKVVAQAAKDALKRMHGEDR